MTFEEKFVDLGRYGRRCREVAGLAQWMFAHPNDKILLCVPDENEAAKILLELKVFFGVESENITVNVVK